MAINYGKIFKSRGGRPKFVPTEADRRTVMYLKAAGATLDDICACLGENGIDVNTLYKYFDKELRTAQQNVIQLAMVSLVRGIKNGEPWAVQMYLKCRAGFKETSAHQFVDQEGKDRPFMLADADALIAAAEEGT